MVPPHATPDAARAAMAEAVRADNVTQAEQILIDTGTGRARRGHRSPRLGARAGQCLVAL